MQPPSSPFMRVRAPSQSPPSSCVSPPPRASRWSSLRARAAYRFDLLLSHPCSSVLLFVVCVVVVVGCGGLGVYFLSHRERHLSLSASLYKSGQFVADPAAMFEEAHGSIDFCIALVVTLAGMLLLASLIGGVSELIAEKHRQLKRGKNAIVERGHFLICGWNDKASAILQQLAEAQCRPNEFTVVFLSDRDKEEMDEELQAVELTQPIRFLCRMGDAWNADSLRGVSVDTARAIILLSTVGDNVSDAPSVKALLAILAITQQRDTPAHAAADTYHGTQPQREATAAAASAAAAAALASSSSCAVQSIVVECVESENVSLLESLDRRITALSPRQLIGRLLVQTSRQCGLSVVYSSLLAFGGSEFYLFPCPAALVGLSFGALVDALDDGAVVIGVLKASERKAKYPSMLNPREDHVIIEQGDAIVVLAENANSFGINQEAHKHTHQGSATESEGLQSISSDTMPPSADDRQPLLSRSPGVDQGSSSRPPAGSMSSSLVVPACSSYGSSSSFLSLSPRARACPSESRLPLPTWRESAPLPRHILIVEWRSDIDSMLEQLNEYVHAGSTVTIYWHKPIAERQSVYAPVGPRELCNLRILHVQGSTQNHSEFERFFMSHRQSYDSVLVLSDVPAVLSLVQAKEADARALMTTIIIDSVIKADASKTEHAARSNQRNDAALQSAAASLAPPGTASVPSAAAPVRSASRPAIVSEISDVSTKHLVQSYDHTVGEWIVSHELVACALVQMAYEPTAKSILSELLLPYGNEIYLRDCRYYVPVGLPVSFVDVYRVGRLRHEIVIGYVLRAAPAAAAAAGSSSSGLMCAPVLNPSNKRQRCLTFEEGDQIVVIAQERG